MALTTTLPPVSAPSPSETPLPNAPGSTPKSRPHDAPRHDRRPGSGRGPMRQRRPKLGPVGHPHGQARERPQVHLTTRGVAASWVVGLLTLAIIAFGLLQGAQPAAPAAVGTTSVTVLPGQTLWGIAESVNPQADPRVTVQAIRNVNGLESGSTLRSGSVISVPVFAAPR